MDPARCHQCPAYFFKNPAAHAEPQIRSPQFPPSPPAPTKRASCGIRTLTRILRIERDPSIIVGYATLRYRIPRSLNPVGPSSPTSPPFKPIDFPSRATCDTRNGPCNRPKPICTLRKPTRHPPHPTRQSQKATCGVAKRTCRSREAICHRVKAICRSRKPTCNSPKPIRHSTLASAKSNFRSRARLRREGGFEPAGGICCAELQNHPRSANLRLPFYHQPIPINSSSPHSMTIPSHSHFRTQVHQRSPSERRVPKNTPGVLSRFVCPLPLPSTANNQPHRIPFGEPPAPSAKAQNYSALSS